MTELPTEPVQRLIGKYEQRISKLEEVNGKLCAEINRQERVIEALKGYKQAAEYWKGMYEKLFFEKGGGKLTAEQVMAIAGKHQPDYCSDTHVCFDWQAIADELNAALGGGECENVGEITDFCCSECGARLYTETTDGYTMIEADEHTIIKQPKYCPNCGKAVKR